MTAKQSPTGGHVFAFRGRQGDPIRIISLLMHVNMQCRAMGGMVGAVASPLSLGPMAFQWQLAKRPWKGAEKGFSGDRSEENLPPYRLYSHYSGRFRAFADEISGSGGCEGRAWGFFSSLSEGSVRVALGQGRQDRADPGSIGDAAGRVRRTRRCPGGSLPRPEVAMTATNLGRPVTAKNRVICRFGIPAKPCLAMITHAECHQIAAGTSRGIAGGCYAFIGRSEVPGGVSESFSTGRQATLLIGSGHLPRRPTSCNWSWRCPGDVRAMSGIARCDGRQAAPALGRHPPTSRGADRSRITFRASRSPAPANANRARCGGKLRRLGEDVTAMRRQIGPLW